MGDLQVFLDGIRHSLREGALKVTDEEFFENLLQSEDTFIEHEGDLWDFKESWPFSYSDDYFLSLVKHVCGFANNRGGILIFNVVDNSRRYKKSAIKTNVDKFITAINQITTPSPKIEYREFSRSGMQLPTIIIYPQQIQKLPSAIRPIGKYQTRWVVRVGHETVVAGARDIPTLFCRPQLRDEGDTGGIIEAALPPSPATLRHFVKRYELMTPVFSWLHDANQPRLFIYGRGGSGKTTIAYEVAKHVAEYGFRLEGNRNDDIQIVILVSAKQTELDVVAGEGRAFLSTDFNDTKTLFSAILTLSGWYVKDDIEQKPIEWLRDQLKKLFDEMNCLVVIDDVDTITTKKEDAGLEDLFLIAARATKRCKLLYTLRNVPTYAIKSAIEVPGLSGSDEIDEFFALCADRFRVPMPSGEEIKRIVANAEGRPLAIESICALRRSCSNYDTALNRFLQHAGDGARKYVFQREWDALSPNNRARSVLAALCLLKTPATADSLQGILSFDEDSLSEAIAEAQDMFIDVDETPNGSTYTVGSLTRGFLLQEARNLDRFEQIKARVDNFRKKFHPRLPAISDVRSRAMRLLSAAERSGEHSHGDRAWQVLSDPSLAPNIREAPEFKELLGEVALKLVPPRITEAREALRYAMDLGYHIDPMVLRSWFVTEARSGAGAEQCARIWAYVRSGRSYTSVDRIEFSLLEHGRLHALGKSMRFDNHERATELLVTSLIGHLENFRLATINGHIKVARIEEYARNTMYLVLYEMKRASDTKAICEVLDKIASGETMYFDPVVSPLCEFYLSLNKDALSSGEVARLSNASTRMRKAIENEQRWADLEARKRLIPALRAI